MEPRSLGCSYASKKKWAKDGAGDFRCRGSPFESNSIATFTGGIFRDLAHHGELAEFYTMRQVRRTFAGKDLRTITTKIENPTDPKHVDAANRHDPFSFPPFMFEFVPPKGCAPSARVPDVGTREEGGVQARHPNLPQEKL